MRIVEQSAELEWVTPQALEVIERAGRLCYKSDSDNNKETATKFVQRIVKAGHFSVTEHASASFRIISDRAILNELVRHRVGMSYSQESSRYVNYNKDKFGKEIKVIRPSNLDDSAFFTWVSACKTAESAYMELCATGVSPQDARSILPLCTKSEIVTTGTMRAWRHFLELRLTKGAHPDMRILAKMVYDKLMETECACIFEDLGELYEGN